MSFYYVQQFAVLPPATYNQSFLTHLLPHTLTPYILELTYTSNDLRDFAQSFGDKGEPFRWDEERRFLLRCELDALYFGLYLGFGDWSSATVYEETPEQHAELIRYFPTPLDAINYIMETFPIVKRKDLAKYDGVYRTKETILAMYQEMVTAIQTGTPYKTHLDPPSGDDRVRHSNKQSNLKQLNKALNWTRLILKTWNCTISREILENTILFVYNPSLRKSFGNKVIHSISNQNKSPQSTIDCVSGMDSILRMLVNVGQISISSHEGMQMITSIPKQVENFSEKDKQIVAESIAIVKKLSQTLGERNIKTYIQNELYEPVVF
jgi:hypothetical protein